jgi:hypothetical protein
VIREDPTHLHALVACAQPAACTSAAAHHSTAMFEWGKEKTSRNDHGFQWTSRTPALAQRARQDGKPQWGLGHELAGSAATAGPGIRSNPATRSASSSIHCATAGTAARGAFVFADGRKLDQLPQRAP